MHYKVKLRRRSISFDNLTQFIHDYNIRTKFGRSYYDMLSDNSMRDKVGPLKIIRLPSERSPHQSMGIYQQSKKNSLRALSIKNENLNDPMAVLSK